MSLITEAPNTWKFNRIEEELDDSAVIVVNSNLPLLLRDGLTRQKINKVMEDLNTIKQLNVTEIYNTLHQTTEHALYQVNTQHS